MNCLVKGDIYELLSEVDAGKRAEHVAGRGAFVFVAVANSVPSFRSPLGELDSPNGGGLVVELFGRHDLA